MNKGDRVRLDNLDDEQIIVLGTVISRSLVGYTRVEWDGASTEAVWYSPKSAKKLLTVVTGDDAIVRHEWENFTNGGADASCLHCGVQQTDTNEFEACR